MARGCRKNHSESWCINWSWDTTIRVTRWNGAYWDSDSEMPQIHPPSPTLERSTYFRGFIRQPRAKAVVWRLAVFASCLRSEPIVSKRSGMSPDLRQPLLERAVSANAKRCPLVQSGRSASLAGADSQAAEIPQKQQRDRTHTPDGRFVGRAWARCRNPTR